jgi:chromosome segregation protein
MDGVYGTIGDLAKSPAEYSTALGIAAAGKLQFVITENDEVASGAIQYLKEEKLGRVTFLPLNKLKPWTSRPSAGKALSTCREPPRVRPEVRAGIPCRPGSDDCR